MIKIIIPPEDQKKLATLRYRHPSRIVRRRFAILHSRYAQRKALGLFESRREIK
jgi:hypothetical protein